jgi:hypothetical protein
MARKEKKAVLPTTSLAFVGLACFFIVGAGAGFLWNKSQIHFLGQQIRTLEIQLEAAKGRRLALEQNYARMCTHTELEALVKKMKLPLGPPQPDQMVKLPEVALGAREEKLIARGGDEEGTN